MRKEESPIEGKAAQFTKPKVFHKNHKVFHIDNFAYFSAFASTSRKNHQFYECGKLKIRKNSR